MAIKQGRVVAKIVTSRGDGKRVHGSTHTIPEFWPVKGSFSPEELKVINTEEPVLGFVDSNGIMRDRSGEAGLWLLAGQYDVANVPNVRRILVTEDHVYDSPLDLATVTNYVPPPGSTMQVFLIPSGAEDYQVLSTVNGELIWIDRAESGSIPGRDGVDGADGAEGPPGRDGVDGADGAEGPPGRDGVDGSDGAEGPPGRDGTDGVNWFEAPQEVVNVTGPSYTLTPADAYRLILASDVELVLDSNTLPVGSRVDIVSIGTDTVSVADGADMTIYSTSTLLARARYSAMTLVVTSSTSALLIGDLRQL